MITTSDMSILSEKTATVDINKLVNELRGFNTDEFAYIFAGYSFIEHLKVYKYQIPLT